MVTWRYVYNPQSVSFRVKLEKLVYKVGWEVDFTIRRIKRGDILVVVLIVYVWRNAWYGVNRVCVCVNNLYFFRNTWWYVDLTINACDRGDIIGVFSAR